MVQDANTSVSIIENFIMIPDISGFEYREELRTEWITETEVPYFSSGKSLWNKGIHIPIYKFLSSWMNVCSIAACLYYFLFVD